MERNPDGIEQRIDAKNDHHGRSWQQPWKRMFPGKKLRQSKEPALFGADASV
jgi:hypothetical protein